MQSAWAYNHFKVVTLPSEKPVQSDVLLIPGLMSNGEVWQNTVNELRQTYNVHVMSISGFAGTPKFNDFSMHNLQSDIIDFLKKNGASSEKDETHLKKMTLIGHSLGGFLGISVALKAPELVNKVISIDGLPYIGPVFTGSNETTPCHLKRQADALLNMYSNMSAQQLLAHSRFSVNRQASSEIHQKYILSMIERSDPLTAGKAMHFMMTTDLRDELKNLEPTLLLLGASGGLNRSEQKLNTERLYYEQIAAAPHATVKMNTDSLHFIMYDDPTWLSQQIKTFIKE